ncbi:MAG TPA: GTP 3',8-cyclase MoaA [Pseudobdellovibrionaceae bacterium]|jgi:cyclic pyranopterin phosphate synthase
MRALLRDSYDRQFQYLRLSLTEVCNFRCSYCLPNGYKSSCSDFPLGESEVFHLLQAFSELGISKVRLTGGEPTIRSDLVSLVQKISQIEGIDKIALTTNGYRLQSLAAPLFEAGLTNLNVSIDTLQEDKFQKITGKSNLKNVLAGMEKAISVGIPAVKINTVLLKDLNDIELPEFMEFVRKVPVSWRFIELMQTGNNKDFFRQRHLSTKVIDSYLRDRGWSEVSKQATDGPATEFSHPDYLGRIGIIAPYSKDFCKSCNRLRVSSRGALQLCLFGEGQVNLRHLLQASEQKEELKSKIEKSLFLKSVGHELHSGLTGQTQNLSMIGG